jgi:hypothetical protein
MKSVAGFIAGVALLLLPGLSLAASIPGPGSCGPRSHFLEWMTDAGATTLGYSLVDVIHPQTGQVVRQLELSFWSNAAGESAVATFQQHDDPQKGRIAFGCIVLRGEALQTAPIYQTGSGA